MADLAHLSGGAVLALALALLAQRRLGAMVFALAAQSGALAVGVACQAWVQHAPALGVAALAVAGVNAVAVPAAFARLPEDGGVVATALGVGARLGVAIALAALAVLAVLPAGLPTLDRESLALALAATLAGLLMTQCWPDPPARTIGLLATGNGLLLAVTAAPGMPLATTTTLALLAAGGAVVGGLVRSRGGAR
jgi:hydrogenase-4 component E